MAAHLRAVVKQSFSPEARVVTITLSPHLTPLISWLLGTDSSPSTKGSPSIRLLIEEEAIGEYGKVALPERRAVDASRVRHLFNELQNFDPDDQAPTGQDPPTVRWTIGAATLFK